MKKPIIFCNFFNFSTEFLVRKNVALECKNSKELIPMINNVIQNNLVSGEYYNDFIKKFYFSDDGQASERTAKIILNLFKNEEI